MSDYGQSTAYDYDPPAAPEVDHEAPSGYDSYYANEDPYGTNSTDGGYEAYTEAENYEDPVEYEAPEGEAPGWVEGNNPAQAAIDAVTAATAATGATGATLSPEEQLQALLDDFNAPDIQIDSETFQAYYMDENGEKVIVADYSNLKGYTQQLLDMEVPDLASWMTGQVLEFGSLDDLQALMDSQIADVGTISEEERQEALDYAASTFGLGSTEYTDLLEELTGQMADTSTIAGFSDEQMAAYERATARDIAQQAEYANRMVNNIMASTGSATRALAAADSYTNSINDYAIQSRTQLIEDDFAAQQANIASKQEFWTSLVTTGQMAQDTYIEQMMSAEATALQGYATQMQNVLLENDQYLSMYSADLEAIQLSMDTVYKGIMAELGVQGAVLDASQSFFDNYLAGFNAEAEALIGSLEIAEAAIENEEEAEANTWSAVWDGLSIAAGIITGIATMNPLAGATVATAMSSIA